MSRVKITVLIIGIFAVIFGVIGIPDAIKIHNNDIKDIETEKNGSLETGDLVQGNIYWGYDEVAVSKTTRTYGFVPVSSSEVPYYVVELNDRYAVVSAGNKDVQTQLETLAKETQRYDNGISDAEPSPVKITGQVVEMPGKVQEYLKQYFKEAGFTDGEYAQLVDDSCVINCVQYDSMKKIPFIGIGIGALFIAIFVILLVKGRGKTVYVGENPANF